MELRGEQKSQPDLADVLKQLEVARTEIKNLRSQIISLKFSFRKDVENIQRQLSEGVIDPAASTSRAQPETCDCELAGWKSIGLVHTWFPGKRGVPRQAALSPEAQGTITLSPVVINNPAYSISGLEEFSHFWIIFHFHQTCGAHVKTKVAPPRLGGTRVGLFGTRSPHRPCPIGLSLVKLERIEGNTIYFTGVDMVDGTPVLDIKPYIPQYDDPRCLPSRSQPRDVVDSNQEVEPLEAGDMNATDRLVEGETGSDSPLQRLRLPTPEDTNGSSGSSPVDEAAALFSNASLEEHANLREAPDGEEGPIQVASWINSPPSRVLQVSFAERALTQLSALQDHAALKATVTRLLEQDPRSAYLRRKLGSQFYTFRIDSLYVSVKFDDAAGVVTVTSIQQAV